MECKIYPFNSLGDYIYADAVALYKGKWLLSRHIKRATWETQGGHIEAGETPLGAARRELYEESGALDFDMEPLCDYWLSGELGGVQLLGNSQVFLATVHTLGEIPDSSEMECVCMFDSLPNTLTYPEVTQALLPLVMEKLRERV